MTGLMKFTVHPGQEVVETLTKLARLHNVPNAAIVSLIGAVDFCDLSTMSLDSHADDVHTKLHAPLELSGTGEIVDTTVHIHCTVSGASRTAHGATLGGHLHKADVVHHFVHAYILPLD